MILCQDRLHFASALKKAGPPLISATPLSRKLPLTSGGVFIAYLLRLKDALSNWARVTARAQFKRCASCIII